MSLGFRWVWGLGDAGGFLGVCLYVWVGLVSIVVGWGCLGCLGFGCFVLYVVVFFGTLCCFRVCLCLFIGLVYFGICYFMQFSFCCLFGGWFGWFGWVCCVICVDSMFCCFVVLLLGLGTCILLFGVRLGFGFCLLLCWGLGGLFALRCIGAGGCCVVWALLCWFWGLFVF